MLNNPSLSIPEVYLSHAGWTAMPSIGMFTRIAGSIHRGLLHGKWFLVFGVGCRNGFFSGVRSRSRNKEEHPQVVHRFSCVSPRSPKHSPSEERDQRRDTVPGFRRSCDHGSSRPFFPGRGLTRRKPVARWMLPPVASGTGGVYT